jgi:branched-chain amino acid transport system permease protein
MARFYMLGAYLAYHAGRASVRPHAARLLGRSCWPRSSSALVGVVESRAPAAHLPRAGAVPAAGDLRRRADRAGHRAGIWGPEDLLGPRAPGCNGFVEMMGQRFPAYELLPDRHRAGGARPALAAVPPARAGARWCGPRRRTARWSARSASTRPCCSPRSSSAPSWPGSAARCRSRARRSTSQMDLAIITEAFVVTWWVGGHRQRLPGAYHRRGADRHAACLRHRDLPKITLVLVFLVMAVVLVVQALRPDGQAPGRQRAAMPGIGHPAAPPGHHNALVWLAALAVLLARRCIVADYLLT